ncbi:hypothetical protein [Kiloniella laminariae]|uniref:hypothetical protein n=1 Tax=Kiloniella laminariae TaxID=454162 RepID=UPI0003A0CEAC|nr:hypothetical protein [Kiloniella laminariae]
MENNRHALIDYQLKSLTVTDTTQIREVLLRRVFDVWSSARANNPEQVPTREEMNLPFSISFALPQVVLFQVEENPRRYLYRLQGTEHVHNIGKDSTGTYMHQSFSGPFYELILSLNNAAVDKRGAEYSTFYTPWISVQKYARLALPLRQSGTEQITQLLIVAELAFDRNKMVPYKDGIVQ